MIKTIHMFWSNATTGHVMQNVSARGVGYTFTVHRTDPVTGDVTPVMTLRASELQDVRVVLDQAVSLIEHLTDGGSHAAWCERRGYEMPSPPTGTEPPPPFNHETCKSRFDDPTA